MSSQGRLIAAPSKTGRIALRCKTCGCKETVSVAFASKRRVFCSTCSSLLRDPDAGQRTTDLAPVSRGETRRQRPVDATRTSKSEDASTDCRPDERLIGMEKHIMAMGVLYRLIGVLGVVASVLLAAAVGPVAGLGGVFFLAAILLGHHLANYRTWARWGVVVLVVLSAALQVFGLLFGSAGLVSSAFSLLWDGAMLVVLFSPAANTIFTERYRHLVQRTSTVSVPFWTSPFFFVPIGMIMISLALAFAR